MRGGENGSGANGRREGSPLDVQIETRGGLGELFVVAFFCAACWLVVGLLVVATLMLRSGWMLPLLALALLAGLGVGLFPTLLYRRRQRLAEAALRAVVAEMPEQVLIDARAREPRLREMTER